MGRGRRAYKRPSKKRPMPPATIRPATARFTMRLCDTHVRLFVLLWLRLVERDSQRFGNFHRGDFCVLWKFGLAVSWRSCLGGCCDVVVRWEKGDLRAVARTGGGGGLCARRIGLSRKSGSGAWTKLEDGCLMAWVGGARRK